MEDHFLDGHLNVTEDVWDEAKHICGRVVSGGLLRKPLATIAATSIYIACRERRIPITIEELSLATHQKCVDIGRSYRRLTIKLGIVPQATSEIEYLPRAVSRLGLSKKVEALSLAIEKAAIQSGMCGRKPMTLAAAAIYTACQSAGEEKTQSEVADAAGVSVIGLRDCSRALRRFVPRNSLRKLLKTSTVQTEEGRFSASPSSPGRRRVPIAFG